MTVPVQNLTPANAAPGVSPDKPKGRAYDRYMRIGAFGVLARW